MNVEQEKQEDGRDAFCVYKEDISAYDFSLNNISVSVGKKQLLKDAFWRIKCGKRYGRVGSTGQGKSTLLKLLAWGKISLPKNIYILIVEKGIVVPDDRTILEAVYVPSEKQITLKEEYNALQIGENGDVEKMVKFERLYAELKLTVDDDLTIAKNLLNGLGVPFAIQNNETKSMNLETRMRVSLARPLLLEPTMLLLDDPSHYLDYKALSWLSDYLRKWKKTLVVVCRDKDFLYTACDEILDLSCLKIDGYSGSFTSSSSMAKVPVQCTFYRCQRYTCI